MTKIVLAGVGNMGGSLLRGWIANWDRSARYHVVDPVDETFKTHPRVTYHSEAADLPVGLCPDIVINAVKPAMMPEALRQLKPHLTEKTCLASVAAGVTISSIRSIVGSRSGIARVMPNIGAMAGYSVSAGYACQSVSAEMKTILDEMFSAIGQMSWLEEEESLHVVTAVSGSGPAYFFAFCEALCAAAIEHGLPSAVAQNLASGTAIAAGRLLEGGRKPDDLRQMVSSPNGTTESGIAALTKNDELNRLVLNAVVAANKRSVQLASEFRSEGQPLP